MKVLNFGSLNLDYVYDVSHMVRPGETLAAGKMEIFCGGKGLNQSIALARAGAQVYHAGCIGDDGSILKEACLEAGVDCRHIKTVEGKTGHAIIQVDPEGQNCILLFGGANMCITSEYINQVLDDFAEGDMLVLQNEINRLDQIVETAHKRGMKIVLNPSPFNDRLGTVDFNKLSTIILNEVEGEQLTGSKDPEEILTWMKLRFPQMEVILTLGSEGALYQMGDTRYHQPVYPVNVVDTTAAGDTFTGYYLAGILSGASVSDSLDQAAKAASIAVTKPGAVPSIPFKNQL